MHPYRILLEPQGGEGNGNGGDPSTSKSDDKTKDFDVEAAVQSLLAKHGNAERALGYLLRDNQGYRAKNADLKKKVPGDGAVVLTGDDAKAWNEYQALGKAGDLKTALDERTSLREELAGVRRAELHNTAATAHGYKASVLSDLAASKGLQIEVKEEKVNGTPAPVAYVKHKDDQGKDAETKLPDYVKKHLADYLPSLQVKPDAVTGRTGTTPAPGHAGPPPSHDRPASLYGKLSPF